MQSMYIILLYNYLFLYFFYFYTWLCKLPCNIIIIIINCFYYAKSRHSDTEIRSHYQEYIIQSTLYLDILRCLNECDILVTN